MNKDQIRNFCIIAHINHGKSTLADRLLEITGTVEKRKLVSQTLDNMELERERGITIKLKAVRMNYRYENIDYQLNLIDTPGHVDFSYEVSRSLAACEGALLVVDAAQGIEAQTISNMQKAKDSNLTVIPVLNKIDLENANTERISSDLVRTFGFKKSDIVHVSAKTGDGVNNLLEKIIKKIPIPSGDEKKPLKGLIFDTLYDEYMGVIALTKIIDGSITKEDIKNKDKIKMLATKATSAIESVGILKPHRVKVDYLSSGEVGYIVTGIKNIKKVRVGDTITFEKDSEKTAPFKGYKEVKPFVFASLYPTENNKFPNLRDALEKLSLTDASLSFEPESSSALGFGFKCGFLGLLHAEIVQERLEREYDLDLISTTPTVEYKIYLTNNKIESIKTASELPETTKIERIEEPWILLNIFSPSKYTGGIIKLCEGRRGVLRKMEYPSADSVFFKYELPLAELIHNFFDDLKTISSGFASLDYDFLDYRKAKVVKLNILVHGKAIEPLSQIVLKEKAQEAGKQLILQLKDIIPRQQFKVSLQAAIGGKIIARDDIPAMRKKVLAGIYGGHRERKDKLLETQKKGKKRMKKFGKVDIPQEAFRQVLKT